MIEISHDGPSLVIGTSELELPFPVEDTLRYDDLVVVLVKPPSDMNIRDNVFAFDTEGEYQWRIEPPTMKNIQGAEVYTKILERDGELVAKTWQGHVYRVDPESGSIEHKDHHP